ncbi:MAG TPA: YqiA/YcfP family alpha/beta fold hydrolase [Vicinamibacterales bacterium]|nr:YqiA/YcfP family alpha/beta fold hydrolase [Vicinamibacterales bacterium]
MRVLYLHGFASSAQSTKAAFLSERLAGHGIRLEAPDFNQPEFRTLTMTRMLQRLTDEVGRFGDSVTIIGSSLGGTLGVLAAAQLGSKVERLVLFAPAVMFASPEHHLLPPDGIAAWRSRGAMPFMHYGYNEERLLDYTFYEDSLKYDAFNAAFPQPTIVFQGLRDAVVDARAVEEFANRRPNVTLSLLDDDHQLLASLPRIWDGIEDFLGLAE